MHNAGKGVIGMKILGEGRHQGRPSASDASLRYVLGLGTVDAFIIGFESTEQVDDLLKRTADALAFVANAAARPPGIGRAFPRSEPRRGRFKLPAIRPARRRAGLNPPTSQTSRTTGKPLLAGTFLPKILWS